jgi:hypothetical protein
VVDIQGMIEYIYEKEQLQNQNESSDDDDDSELFHHNTYHTFN